MADEEGRERMKRLAIMVASTMGFVLSLAGTALASSHYPPEGGGVEGGGGGVAGGGGAGAGEVAFTGASVTLGLVLVAALVVIGVAALMIARRRRAVAAQH